jgi:lipopolysaccharide transport system ATP-binding protein
MKDVAVDGRTILFVSHNMPTVQNLCSRAVWLKDGLYKEEGMAVEVVRNYLDETASFTSVALSERKDREGNGTVLIKSISIFDAITGVSVIQAHSGQSLRFEIEYEAQSYANDLIEHLQVGLPFFDSNENFVTTLNNELVGFEFKKMPLYGIIECIVEELPFMDGTYYIGVNLKIDGSISDKVMNCIKLPVLPADFYGVEKFRVSEKGGIYLKQKWG